jgi:hypothetical protein
MILPSVPQVKPVPKPITLADGQTFQVMVVTPTYGQRFNDEGREMRAYAGTAEDAWLNYRVGRIRDSIVDWQDVTNEKEQPIPFSTARLLGLMEAAPETVPQLMAIANEAFRPFLLPALKQPQDTSGAGPAESSPAISPTQSDSTQTSDEPADSPADLESEPAN